MAGQAPTDKIFKAYINLEMQLGNIDRCRTLHSKWLEHDSANCEAWVQVSVLSLFLLVSSFPVLLILSFRPLLLCSFPFPFKFADLERTLGEISRARALFVLAVDQPFLDMPEVLWKAFIGMFCALVFFLLLSLSLGMRVCVLFVYVGRGCACVCAGSAVRATHP